MDLKIADDILAYYYSIHPNIEHISDVYRKKNIKYDNDVKRVFEFLKRENYIEPEGGLHFKLGDPAVDIIEIHGSLQQYYNALKEEEKEAAILQEISKQKLIYDTKISKWQTKTFWPVFIFGLIGGCLGIASFIMQVMPKKDTKPKQEIAHPVQKTDSTKTIKQAILKPAKSSNEKEEEKALLD